jgi:hypothetical protein
MSEATEQSIEQIQNHIAEEQAEIAELKAEEISTTGEIAPAGVRPALVNPVREHAPVHRPAAQTVGASLPLQVLER